MKLTFFGTRGEIEARTPRQHMHSSLLISCRGARVMIDCAVFQAPGVVRVRVRIRASAGRACIFYAPNLIFIRDRTAALKDVQIYIGDGATLTCSFIRRRAKALIGHASVRTQLMWCEKERVPRAIITHRGSEIVTSDERKLTAKLRAIGAERGVEASIANDGMKLTL